MHTAFTDLGIPLPREPRGMIDSVVVHAHGRIDVSGWESPGAGEPAADLAVMVRDRAARRVWAARVARPDVARALGVADGFAGFVVTFFHDGRHEGPATLGLHGAQGRLAEFVAPCSGGGAAFATLFSDPGSCATGHFFAVGEPNERVSDDLIALVESVSRTGDTVLDLGCGTGALVRFLHRKGVKVRGLELSEARGGPPSAGGGHRGPAVALRR